MLKLHIATDNAAFEDEPVRECARILRELADRLECRAAVDQFHVLRDVNGNAVGECEAHMSPADEDEG